MKTPLEPIPTEQLVAPDSAQARPRVQLNQTTEEIPPQRAVVKATVSPLYKLYPWLLSASVCLSAVLCWMYVSKPVIVTAAPTSVDNSFLTEPQPEDKGLEPLETPIAASNNVPSLIPSDDKLPGEEPSQKNSSQRGSEPKIHAVTPQVADNGSIQSSSENTGWENTNLKVQHILRADNGDGELEKIILTVPVRYESRTMRWAPQDVLQARNILSRLMVYERDLNRLRLQGESILTDWNGLLKRTVPSGVLRADSPSLPYNRGYANAPQGLPDSSSVIKVGDKEPASE